MMITSVSRNPVIHFLRKNLNWAKNIANYLRYTYLRLCCLNDTNVLYCIIHICMLYQYYLLFAITNMMAWYIFTDIENDKQNSKLADCNLYFQTNNFPTRVVTMIVVLAYFFAQCYYAVVSNVFISYTVRSRLILSIETYGLLISCESVAQKSSSVKHRNKMFIDIVLTHWPLALVCAGFILILIFMWVHLFVMHFREREDEIPNRTPCFSHMLLETHAPNCYLVSSHLPNFSSNQGMLEITS